MTGALLANSAGGGNAVRLAGAASGSPVVIGTDASSADPNVGVVLGSPRGTGAVTLLPPDSAYTLASAVVVSGGTSGYVVGDILTISGGTTGGTFPAAATMKVTAVSAGVITAVAMQAQGSYSATPGNPVSVTGGSGTGSPTFTATWGNDGAARGVNAVDLQTSRSSTTQVASGTQATVGGGNGNTASGNTSTVGGGNLNTASATGAAVPGGNSNTADGSYSMASGSNTSTHGIYGAQVFGAGGFAVRGDAQGGQYTLRGTSTAGAAVRLTADGSGTAGSYNVANIPNNTAWSATVSVVARDLTTGGSYHWTWQYFSINRGASASTLTFTTSGPYFQYLGTQTGTPATGSLVYSSDITNGGFNFTFTPVSGNTNTWHVVAVIRTSEVQ
jgi:hypothetical protein